LGRRILADHPFAWGLHFHFHSHFPQRKSSLLNLHVLRDSPRVPFLGRPQRRAGTSMATCVAFSCIPHASFSASAARQPSQRLLASQSTPAVLPFVLHQPRHAAPQRLQQPVRAEGDDARQPTATEVRRAVHARELLRRARYDAHTPCFMRVATVFRAIPAPVLPQEDDELPPWLRKEKLQKMADAEGGLPFGLYLLASSLVAIATVGIRTCQGVTCHAVEVMHACGFMFGPGNDGSAAGHEDDALLLQVGSIFELINQNPIFGVVPPDSPIYLPILGTFAVTGFPTTGVLCSCDAAA
jgi:hypothetical protein